MTTTRHTRLAGATIGLLALVGAVFGSAPAYADDEGDTPAEFSELSSDESALLESDDPVTITIDPATGAFESVELTPVLIQPNSVYSICNTGHACWHGWLSPHIWYGFDGSGATGTWPNRGSFYTSGYYARPCWLYSGSTVCAEAYSPKYSTITWGQELTGKRVYLTT